jgi:hypothetical protein
MTKVSFAAFAVDFGSHHAVAEVGMLTDVLSSDWLEKAGPACSGVELGVRTEKGKAATNA